MEWWEFLMVIVAYSAVSRSFEWIKARRKGKAGQP